MNNLLNSLIIFPKIGESYKFIWFRNFLQFKKTFIVSLFWVVLEPLMYLGAIGFGVGAYINNIDGQSYIDFFFPGLLCSTAMMVPFFEATYTNYTKLTYQKLYNHMLLTKITPQEIVFGEILWATSKGFFGVLGVSFIAMFMGLIQSWNFIAVLAVLMLTSWLFSCIAMLITSMAKNYDSFIYATSGFLIPMTLISGIYFPMDNQHIALQIVSLALPLSHSVAICHYLLNEKFPMAFYFHILYLVLLSYLILNLSIHRITKKLLK